MNKNYCTDDMLNKYFKDMDKAGTTITLKTILTTGTGSITYDVGGSVQQLN